MWKHPGFILGLAVLILLFGFAYQDPATATYPVSDFLDSTFVWYALYWKHVTPLDLTATFGNFIGGLEANAFALNDFNPTLLFYRYWDPFTSAAIVDTFCRLLGFVAIYTLVFYLVRGSRFATWTSASAAVFFALLGYFPALAPSITFTAVALAAVLNIVLGRFRIFSWILLFLSTQVVSLVLGGFALLALLLLIATYAWFHRKESRYRLVSILVVTTVGFLLSQVRALALLLSGFVSHRTSWPRPEHAWFSPSTWRAMSNRMFDALTEGQFDFSSGQRGVPIILLMAVLLITALRFVSRSPRLSGVQLRVGQNIIWCLLCLVVIGAVYASELATFTQISYVFAVPISVYRVAILFPILWAILVGLCAAFLVNVIRSGLAHITLFVIFGAVLTQGVLSHQGVLGRLGTASNVQLGVHEIAAYYDQEEFLDLARAIGRSPRDISMVSLGLDPMKAAYAGFSVRDGYFNNYPREYKDSFRKVIAPELSGRNQTLMDSFDEWGSQIYMFQSSGSSERSPRFDLCALRDLDVEFIIASHDLEIPGVKLAASSRRLRAYALLPDCK